MQNRMYWSRMSIMYNSLKGNIILAFYSILIIFIGGCTTNMNLPNDYDNKLKNFSVSDSECGQISLINKEELEVGEIYIEGPESGKSYYKIPAVNLVKNCEDYEPDFILLYLPNEKLYGTWDSDHWILYTFDNTNWEAIKNNPLKYINHQWNDSDGIFNPAGKYEVIKGWPF